MFSMDQDCLDLILAFLPPIVDAGATLSHRRNKGLLLAVRDKITVRKLNLEFFNSGINDGLPSSLVRESVILSGCLAGHPNIVPLLHIESPTVNQVRLVYPLIRFNLREYFEKEIGSKSDRIRDVGHQLFRALAFAHARGVVHRNIRPENILVSADGTVQLADWTQARTLAVVPDDRCPLTPEESKNRPQTEKERARLRYRAPEIILRLKSYDFAIDIWSAGVVLLELMLSSNLPWSQCCSESELLFSILSLVGVPKIDDWPDGLLSLQLSCGVPIIVSPDFLNLSRNPDYVLSESNSVWERIKIEQGPEALLFLGKCLNVIPSKRPSASACLESSFLLGQIDEKSSDWFLEATREANHRIPSDLSSTNKLTQRLECVGGWVFKLARLMDCHNSKPVHLAVLLFESLPVKKNLNRFALLAACLKIAIRFQSSKDMFKQVNCSEIVSACNRAISESEIVEAEQFVLNHMHAVVDCFDSTVVDHIEFLVSACGPNTEQLRFAAFYIADICLLDDGFSKLHVKVSDQATACLVLAGQWLGAVLTQNVLSHCSIDSLQVAVSACALALTETVAKIATFDEGIVERIILWNYRGRIPKTKSQTWLTSRSYIETLVGCSGSLTRRRSSLATPPKPLLLRKSTIEHAAQWAIESRRKKRSRSATPVRNPKRICPSTPKENVDPNFPLTPRRSVRLKAKKSLTIDTGASPN
jgi:serine/threonine protein kinase